MSERPYVTLSCAMSIDGYLDDAEPQRLVLSNAADLDRVDNVRSQNDAIMVGASTVRRDDPRLLVKSAARRRQRLDAGLTASPAKVTVTSSGELPAEAEFFSTGEVPRYVYTPQAKVRRLQSRLGDSALVVGLGDRVTMGALLDDLASERGVSSLMVEGGGALLTQFLAEDLVDELHLVIAPLFVGEPRAPRVVSPARFPWTSAQRAELVATEQLGDVVLLRYALSRRFESVATGASSAGLPQEAAR
jgi:5-amino-6-(5-phosphoribosylamino)uracil reductase